MLLRDLLACGCVGSCIYMLDLHGSASGHPDDGRNAGHPRGFHEWHCDRSFGVEDGDKDEFHGDLERSMHCSHAGKDGAPVSDCHQSGENGVFQAQNHGMDSTKPWSGSCTL